MRICVRIFISHAPRLCRPVVDSHPHVAATFPLLEVMFAGGRPHGTGVRQLQMSVDTGADEFCFSVYFALLRVP